LGSALQLRLEAFVRLSEQDRTLIDQLCRRNVREVGPRRDIVREGDRPRAVNLMLDGWACRYKQLPDGRRQIVSFFVPGDLCDSNIFILREMDHSIASITRLRYAEISPAGFEELTLRSPRITQALWWNELVGAAIAREWTTNVGQRTAFERIAHLLCEMHLRLRVVGLTENGSCAWPLTQTDLADATGLTAVHVNRTLQELRRRELVELQGRRLTIPDLEALQHVAMFNPNYLHLEREGRHLDAND
jgi:CRP-like cAMP-binding protein